MIRHKHRDISEIVDDLQILLNELATIENAPAGTREKTAPKTKQTFSAKGPSGGVKMLLHEGFFSEPKTLPEVVARLRQEGFHYVNQVVSTAMIRLVRSREMVRLPADGGSGKEKWAYAERK